MRSVPQGLRIGRLFPTAAGAWALALGGLPGAVPVDAGAVAGRPDTGGVELPVHQVPNLGAGAEFYFSPDGLHIIGNAKREGDERYHVYVLRTDGSEIRRINDRGADACSFFFPDGRRIIWTSTRDHLDWPAGNYSDPADYPQGAELYSSDMDGSDVRRLTDNRWYDAEVTVSPDGKWVLFGREIDGKMDLWRMRPDGSDAVQITHTDEWQEGGALYLPDSHTIIYRAWKREDQGRKSPLPMSIFTIRDDGSGLRRITSDSGTNWAPYPAPDGRHFFFVKVLPPRNFEIYLGDLESSAEVRLTWNDGFDGFPAVSPDGHWLLFSSSRDAAPGAHTLGVYLMDIATLRVGPPPAR